MHMCSDVDVLHVSKAKMCHHRETHIFNKKKRLFCIVLFFLLFVFLFVLYLFDAKWNWYFVLLAAAVAFVDTIYTCALCLRFAVREQMGFHFAIIRE